MTPTILKVLHVLFIFVWIGTLLCLTRFLGYLSKEEPSTQIRLAKICKRMYLFVDLPSMILAIVLGLVLLFYTKFGQSMGWFHMKMTFALALVICDIICGKMIFNLNKQGFAKGSIKYKILHSITALMLIGTLVSIYVVRNKEGEIRSRVLSEQNSAIK
jgi:protoporphyrinogen IX oxidase